MSVIGDSYYTEGQRNLKQGSIMKAMASFKKAAEEGHGGAMAKLGWFYEAGLGTEKDLDKAKEYYEKGVEMGSPEAKGILGEFYFKGFNGEQCVSKGIHLLGEAAKSGDLASITKMIRYIGKKKIPADKEELGFYTAHADKMLRQGQLNEIDLLRLIYLENDKMTDDELMQFGKMFYDLCHYEEAEEIFEGIVMRKNSLEHIKYEEKLKDMTGYVTAGKRAEYWLGIIEFK